MCLYNKLVVSCFPYLPTKSSHSHGGRQREHHQTFIDETEVSHSLWGHDLVQSTDPWTLEDAEPLAVAELSVKAPHRDDEHQVADGPQEYTHYKPWNQKVPLVQVSELLGGQNNKDHLHHQQWQEGQPTPQAPPHQERLPTLCHREATEVDIQQRVADKLAEEAGEGEGVDVDL